MNGTTSPATQNGVFRFLEIPPEIRLYVYEAFLSDRQIKVSKEFSRSETPDYIRDGHDYGFQLLQVNKLIHQEFFHVLYGSELVFPYYGRIDPIQRLLTTNVPCGLHLKRISVQKYARDSLQNLLNIVQLAHNLTSIKLPHANICDGHSWATTDDGHYLIWPDVIAQVTPLIQNLQTKRNISDNSAAKIFGVAVSCTVCWCKPCAHSSLCPQLGSEKCLAEKPKMYHHISGRVWRCCFEYCRIKGITFRQHVGEVEKEFQACLVKALEAGRADAGVVG